jgi:hypothetical protein
MSENVESNHSNSVTKSYFAGMINKILYKMDLPVD